MSELIQFFPEVAERAKTEIDAMFRKVHPVRGDNAKCATGEPYITYSIGMRTPEEAAMALVNTFRVLTQGTALIKNQGEEVALDELCLKYLYWRWFPEVKRMGGWFTASCRAVVSEQLVEDGQSAAVLPRIADGSLEDLVIAILRCKDSQGRALQLRPQDVLRPEVIDQLPRHVR